MGQEGKLQGAKFLKLLRQNPRNQQQPPATLGLVAKNVVFCSLMLKKRNTTKHCMRRDQDRCGGGGGVLLELYMIDPYSNVGIPCIILPIILCTACERHSLISLLVQSAVA